MKEWDKYWRILQWNRLATSDFKESAEVARQCRTAWEQICAILPAKSILPGEFRIPFTVWLREPSLSDLYNDDRRLILCMSDLRDYLELMRWQESRNSSHISDS